MRQLLSVLFGLFVVCAMSFAFHEVALADEPTSVRVNMDNSVRTSRLLPVERVRVARTAVLLGEGLKDSRKKSHALLPVVEQGTYEDSKVFSNAMNIRQPEPQNASAKGDEENAAPMTIVVESIDGSDVILETQAGLVRIPILALPDSARHEGAILVLEHYPVMEAQRREAAQIRVERMKQMSASIIEI